MCNDTTVSKLKNDFHYTLSKFSHELRNPLTLINSGLQMIASAHPEVKEYEHWDDVMDNLDYVKELLDELSAFNNADHVKRENIDTCCYLRTILSSIKPTLDYLEITLETDIPDSLPSIALDRIRVRQMLLNLLKNAWEAVPIPGGKISFSVIPENSGIRIDIRDNGCGISKEQQAAIFQPFFTTKESGTGLGLAVSKQIAQAHSGDITLESTPGQGTVFHIFWDDKELQRSGTTQQTAYMRYVIHAFTCKSEIQRKCGHDQHLPDSQIRHSSSVPYDYIDHTAHDCKNSSGSSCR